jgi:adenine/guanine phosphoribosyltransferase-like PRPP-binding protein
MMVADVKAREDVKFLFSDPKGMEDAVNGFMGMFDREVFDAVVADGMYGCAMAGVIAAKLGRGFIASCHGKVPAAAVKKGMKVVVICSGLTDGKDVLDIIHDAESKGVTVLRAGFVFEDLSAGARKSKVLKGCPFEALVSF